MMRALTAALDGLSPGTLVIMAGDFNFDPALSDGPDSVALGEMIDALDLQRLPNSEPTHGLLGFNLDLLYTRNWPPADTATCQVRFLDADSEVPMLDHASVVCR